MFVRKHFLTLAGAALVLALPAAAQAQPDQPAGQPTDQTAKLPPADPMMSAPAAASQPAAAAAAPPAASDPAAGAKDYPRCSKTVTDSCMQGGGGKAHQGKAARRKKS